MTALPLTDKISQTSRKTKTEKIHSVQFGDGVRQTTTYGINAVRDKWSLTTIPLTKTQRDQWWSAYDVEGKAGYFTWDSFGDKPSTTKWQIVSDPSESQVGGKYYIIQYNIEEVFRT